MTKEGRRDKESSAKRHRLKSNRGKAAWRQALIPSVPALRQLLSGIVNLARRRGPGKVANKARIPVARVPVARFTAWVTIFPVATFQDWLA